MAKKVGRPSTGKKYVSVKIEVSVVRKARLVCTAKGLHVAEYMSNALAPIVSRDAKAVGKLMQENGE